MSIFYLVFYEGPQGWSHLSTIYYAERGAMHGVNKVFGYVYKNCDTCRIIKYETNPEDGTTISETVKEVKRS
jgi:hypothetical protein